MIPPRPIRSLFLLLLLGSALVGCSTIKAGKTAKTSAAAPAPVVQPPPLLPPMSRVVMLPIYTRDRLGEAQHDMDSIFRSELIQALPFEIVQLTRPELVGMIQREQISSVEAIPPASWRAIQEKYAATAVLFTDFTLYRPYRPIAIGVRTKLVDMASLSVLWSADRVIDSADPATAEAALEFAAHSDLATNPRTGEVILQSPRRFAAFVAHEIYATLPAH